MSQLGNYRFLSHLDAPKRYLTLTLDELIVTSISLLLLVLLNQKTLVILSGFALVTMLRRLKRGEGPKALLSLAYWHLPYQLTHFFFPNIPASHHRVWVA